MRHETEIFRIYPELKYELIVLAKKGHAVKDISKRFGVPTTTFYLWRKESENIKSIRLSSKWLAERKNCMDKIRKMAGETPNPPKRGRPNKRSLI